MKNIILTAVILSGLISTPVFAATRTATETPVGTSAAKSSKSLADVKTDMRGMGGMEATKSDRPAGKSGKPLTKTKTDLLGMGGMEAKTSDKPAGMSGKSLANVKTDLQGMGGIDGKK